ncbi:hypothetical protein [Nocardioides albus]|uniref:Uncharacterized protein n=1 Tax=Nocardioides albus TaxID=1841 RepID=A0A7W5A6Y9_9ACTN|nr:hypothetical protein [Nocardioides albus]MBB3090742.1 hypothetical protein [Nocardioides albus]GGU26144.1 hypothetical protein GCM10007979_26260 [Nocardioides albus]
MQRRRDRITPVLFAITVMLALAVAGIIHLAHGGEVIGPFAVADQVSSTTERTNTPYVCWDGNGAGSLTRCPDPRGEDGMQWVFPGHDDAARRGGCSRSETGARDPSTSSGQRLFVECSMSWRGHQVYLHYAYWGEWQTGRKKYDAAGSAPRIEQRPDGAMSLSWRPRRLPTPHGEATWVTAQMVEGHGWSVAAYAGDAEIARAALEEFGEIRDLREWRGRPR